MTRGLLALLLLLVGMPSPGNDDLAIKISLRDEPPSVVGKFDKYEIAFDLSRHYDDPFDPEAINIEARFTAPSGKEITICAFYYLDYPRAEFMKRCERGVSYEQPPAAGGRAGAHWRVRFAPQEEGQHRACLAAKDKQGSCRLDLPAFIAVKSVSGPFYRAEMSGSQFLAGQSR